MGVLEDAAAVARRTADEIAKASAPRMLPGTVRVAGSGTETVTVQIDEPTLSGEPASIPAANLTGVFLRSGDRVMVQFWPPHGVFVTSLIGVAGGSGTAFAPTVLQPTSVTLTSAIGRGLIAGKICQLHVFIDFGGTGTSGNDITIASIPAAFAPRVSASPVTSTGESYSGCGFYFDSGSALYSLTCAFVTSSTIKIWPDILNSGAALGASIAIAAADSLKLDITYEIA